MKRLLVFIVPAVILLCLYLAIDTGGAGTSAASVKPKQQELVNNIELAHVGSGVREQLIVHTGYTVSFNPDWNIANWVAYELTSSETEGAGERRGKFMPDPDVEGDPVLHSDYTNSGYDRGHLAPAADMKWSEEAMTESFYTTNICPQNHNLNSKSWERLEAQVREWAKEFGNIYICTGPIVGNADSTIGCDRKIVVPQAFYKALVATRDGEWYAIAFRMENVSEGSKKELSHFVRTVDEIERMTGIDMFCNLPDSIESLIESEYDLRDWGLQ